MKKIITAMALVTFMGAVALTSLNASPTTTKDRKQKKEQKKTEKEKECRRTCLFS